MVCVLNSAGALREDIFVMVGVKEAHRRLRIGVVDVLGAADCWASLLSMHSGADIPSC